MFLCPFWNLTAQVLSLSLCVKEQFRHSVKYLRVSYPFKCYMMLCALTSQSKGENKEKQRGRTEQTITWQTLMWKSAACCFPESPFTSKPFTHCTVTIDQLSHMLAKNAWNPTKSVCWTKITTLHLFTVTPSIPKPGYPGFSGAQNSVNTHTDE